MIQKIINADLGDTRELLDEYVREGYNVKYLINSFELFSVEKKQLIISRFYNYYMYEFREKINKKEDCILVIKYLLDKKLPMIAYSYLKKIDDPKLTIKKSEIIEMLKRVLGYQYEGMIVTIPEIFDDLSIYRKESELFWQDHLFFSRRIYEQYCDVKKPYYNTSVSRFYYAQKDKSKCHEWIEGIKQIWKDKDVVVVEGIRTHNGVTNGLLDTAKTVERIIGPASGAYEKLDKIFSCCCEYPKDRLFLISLGVAAKSLTERLFLEGYRVLDIGNLDMEYEWFLMQAKTKVKIPKHEIVGEEANLNAGYKKYWEEIKVIVES